MQQISFNNFTWIDIKKPTPDDIAKIKKDFRLHPLIAEEFLTPTLRPKAEEYNGSLFLTIHVPLFNIDLKKTYPAELDIVITENALITSSDEDIFQLTSFFKKLKNSKKKREQHLASSPAALLRYLIEVLLESCFPKLDHISKKLDHIEEEIFAGHEKEMVAEISVVKRDILNFRRTIKPQRSVLESLIQHDFRLISEEVKSYFQDLIGTNIRVWNALESAKETTESLEETNNSLLSNKLNLTMKVLTIFNAVFLPITVYSNLMSMNTPVPLEHNILGFWLHTAFMVLISVLTIIVFKMKKWL
jgi:magnesium transporter